MAIFGSMGMAIIYGLKVAAIWNLNFVAIPQVNISVAMVAMVNHTALAALHVGSRLGGDEPGKDIGIRAQEGGEDGKEDGWENASFQKGDVSWVEPGGSWENTTGGQVDGPFVWETTVSF